MSLDMSHIYDIGMVNRMNRILRSDGRVAILAIDHRQRAIINGLTDFYKLTQKIELVMPFMDAVMTNKEPLAWLVKRNLEVRSEHSFLDGKGLILSINRTGLAGSKFEMDDRLVATPMEANRWGVDCVKFFIKINLQYETTDDQLELTQKVVTSCGELGMPVMLEPVYLSWDPNIGPRFSKESTIHTDIKPETLRLISIIANDFHVPLLKLQYPQGGTRDEKRDAFKEILRCVNAKVILPGGIKGNRIDTLSFIQDAVELGAAGFAIGRNVLLDEKPEIMGYSLQKIIHDKYDAENALKEAQKKFK